MLTQFHSNLPTPRSWPRESSSVLWWRLPLTMVRGRGRPPSAVRAARGSRLDHATPCEGAVTEGGLNARGGGRARGRGLHGGRGWGRRSATATPPPSQACSCGGPPCCFRGSDVLFSTAAKVARAALEALLRAVVVRGTAAAVALLAGREPGESSRSTIPRAPTD